MSLWQAIVLGLVQGLTEFLPVSSTAHLRIVPALLGWGDPGAATSAVIQLGTVAAVLLYFARDLIRLGRAFVSGILARQPLSTADARLAWWVVLGTVPIGVGGLLLKKTIEGSLRSLWVIALSLIVLALVLWWVERRAELKRPLSEAGWRDALVVGLWQALALVPGSSRSGTTLTGALSLGFRREAAARFSFLLSIPATALAGLFELKHLIEAPERPPTVVLAVATAVAFVSGLLAISGLMRFLRTRSTTVFVVYRVGLGLTLLSLLQAGVLSPG
jgi:undecaprenyl-diphosphatase